MHLSTMLRLQILFSAIAFRSIAAQGATCKDASDCSLNGDCSAGNCEKSYASVCDAAWTGSPPCDVMNFEALDKNNMPGYYNKTESSWGGFPVRTLEGYALLHSQMVNSCPLNSWKDNSIVGLSTSTSGDVEGPYKFQREILPHFAHNPTIRFVNGTYLIFFIGGWQTNASDCRKSDIFVKEVNNTRAPTTECDGNSWPETCGPNMPGPMNDTCGPEYAAYHGNGGCGISIASSKSLAGPWTVMPLIIQNQFESDEVYCAHTNPSPVIEDNGRVVIAFNAGFCHHNLETIGIAGARHWSGPYKLLSKKAILRNPDGSPHGCEDPHLWKSNRGWHILVHNQQGPQSDSAYGYSLDATDWTLSPRSPYNCTLHYTDGSTAEASGCGNRPQVVFSESLQQGGAPRWLINGAEAAKPDGGNGTWTLFRKLSH